LLLEDVDWRRGVITVAGKGGGREELPLPPDVGAALAEYLQLRGPDRWTRGLFTHVKAPRGSVTPTDVNAVVRRACQRAAVPDCGTHRLRHALAMDLLQHGAPLHEIGQVLRHHNLQTTAIYARVDLPTLRTVARPWPRVSQ
jgi:integrase